MGNGTKRPATLGGGGNSFEGFEIPEKMKITENGNYKAVIKSSEGMQIVCEGKEIGKDGNNPVQATIDVSLENITPVVDN